MKVMWYEVHLDYKCLQLLNNVMLFVSDLLSVSESLYRCFKYLRCQTFIKLLKLPHSFSFLPNVPRIKTLLTVATDLLIYACRSAECWKFLKPSAGILTFSNVNVLTFHRGWWQIRIRWHDTTGSQLPPYYCHCADHSQPSPAVCLSLN